MALAQAAEAAARQGAFWAFHDALYADQGRIDDPHLWAHCETLGLDLERFQADRRDPAIAERVRARRPRRAAGGRDDDADPVRLARGSACRAGTGARNAPDARLTGFGFRERHD